MRLQVAVRRNTLPEVRVIVNTQSKRTPDIAPPVTISDLIEYVDALIPLTYGDLGLEAYVVEVAATADQTQAYECFHFQEIEDVLRDEDEVVIRTLTSSEAFDRKQGGRFQHTSDGKRLFDGVAWSRRWTAAAISARPEVIIPARKRVKLTYNHDEDNDEPGRSEPRHSLGREIVPYMEREDDYLEEDEDEDEDDGDYEPNGDDEEQESDIEKELEDEDNHTSDRQPSTSPLRITERVEFIDADHLEDDDDDDDGDSSDDDVDEVTDDEMSEGAPASELQALTGNTAMSMTDAGLPRFTRRQRASTEDSVTSQAASSFNGFSSPSKTSRRSVSDTGSHSITNVGEPLGAIREIAEMAEDHRNEQAVAYSSVNGTVPSHLPETQRDEFEGEEVLIVNGDPAAHEPIQATLYQHIEATNGEIAQASSEVSSSEDGSDEDSSSDGSSLADTSSNGTSLADTSSDNASLDDTSADDLDSESSSSDDETDSSQSSDDAQAASPSHNSHDFEKPANGLTTLENGEPSVAQDNFTQPVTDVRPDLPNRNNPPGSGRKTTKRNNSRKKMSRLLSRLKENGKLAQDANFEALREYLKTNPREEDEEGEEGQPERGIAQDEEPVTTIQEQITARAASVAASMLDAEVEDDPPRQVSEPTLLANGSHDASLTAPQVDAFKPHNQAFKATESTVVNESAPTAVIEQSHDRAQNEGEEPSPKRARLDINASRRLIFGGLGVRKPKTVEDENALREKLAKPVRQVQSREVVPAEDVRPAVSTSDDRWKEKFTVLAVECIQEWRKIEPPPFPFKQPWQARRDRDEAKKASRQQAVYEQGLNYDEVDATRDTESIDDTGDIIKMNVRQKKPVEQAPEPLADTTTQTAGTTAADDDDLCDSDFLILPVLTKEDIPRAEHIAYKELEMNKHFEPVHSSYKIAELLSHDGDALSLRLIPRYRRSIGARYDKETGERLYNPFELTNSQDEESDDGLREMGFVEMIAPRIAKAKEVEELTREEQVEAAVNNRPRLRGGHVNEVAEHPPKTVQASEKVSTPRRNEIDGLIKEAGWESAIREEFNSDDREVLVESLSQAAAQAQSPLSCDIHKSDDEDSNAVSYGRRSTSLQAGSPLQGTGGSSTFRESSVPSESMVESVKYPQLSHLEVDTPAQAQSSLLQEAQKPSPTPILPATDITMQTTTFRESEEQLEPEDDPVEESLPSEVPQTQSQNLVSDSFEHNQLDDGHTSSTPESPTYDKQQRGNSSSPLILRMSSPIEPHSDREDEDNESIDSSGFPSLQSLTASQSRKKSDHQAFKSKFTYGRASSGTNGNRNTATNAVDSQLGRFKKSHNSEPRRSPRAVRTLKTIAKSSDWSDTDTSSQTQTQPKQKTQANAQSQSQSQPPAPRDPEPEPEPEPDRDPTPTPTKTTYKASQSQSQHLSQFPETDGDTIVVEPPGYIDLTQSSPSPAKDKDAENKGRNGGHSAAGGRGTHSGGGRKDWPTPPGASFRRAFEGLGEKSYLKKRKRG